MISQFSTDMTGPTSNENSTGHTHTLPQHHSSASTNTHNHPAQLTNKDTESHPHPHSDSESYTHTHTHTHPHSRTVAYSQSHEQPYTHELHQRHLSNHPAQLVQQEQHCTEKSLTQNFIPNLTQNHNQQHSAAHTHTLTHTHTHSHSHSPHNQLKSAESSHSHRNTYSDDQVFDSARILSEGVKNNGCTSSSGLVSTSISNVNVTSNEQTISQDGQDVRHSHLNLKPLLTSNQNSQTTTDASPASTHTHTFAHNHMQPSTSHSSPSTHSTSMQAHLVSTARPPSCPSTSSSPSTSTSTISNVSHRSNTTSIVTLDPVHPGQFKLPHPLSQRSPNFADACQLIRRPATLQLSSRQSSAQSAASVQSTSSTSTSWASHTSTSTQLQAQKSYESEMIHPSSPTMSVVSAGSFVSNLSGLSGASVTSSTLNVLNERTLRSSTSPSHSPEQEQEITKKAKSDHDYSKESSGSAHPTPQLTTHNITSLVNSHSQASPAPAPAGPAPQNNNQGNSPCSVHWLLNHDVVQSDLEKSELNIIGCTRILLHDVNSRRGGAKVATISFLLMNKACELQDNSKQDWLKTDDCLDSPLSNSQLPTRVLLQCKVYSKKGFFNRYARYRRGKVGCSLLHPDIGFFIMESSRVKELIMLNTESAVDAKNPRYALSVDVPYLLFVVCKKKNKSILWEKSIMHPDLSISIQPLPNDHPYSMLSPTPSFRPSLMSHIPDLSEDTQASLSGQISDSARMNKESQSTVSASTEPGLEVIKTEVSLTLQQSNASGEEEDIKSTTSEKNLPLGDHLDFGYVIGENYDSQLMDHAIRLSADQIFEKSHIDQAHAHAHAHAHPFTPSLTSSLHHPYSYHSAVQAVRVNSMTHGHLATTRPITFDEKSHNSVYAALNMNHSTFSSADNQFYRHAARTAYASTTPSRNVFSGGVNTNPISHENSFNNQSLPVSLQVPVSMQMPMSSQLSLPLSMPMTSQYSVPMTHHVPLVSTATTSASSPHTASQSQSTTTSQYGMNATNSRTLNGTTAPSFNSTSSVMPSYAYLPNNFQSGSQSSFPYPYPINNGQQSSTMQSYTSNGLVSNGYNNHNVNNYNEGVVSLPMTSFGSQSQTHSSYAQPYTDSTPVSTNGTSSHFYDHSMKNKLSVNSFSSTPYTSSSAIARPTPRSHNASSSMPLPAAHHANGGNQYQQSSQAQAFSYSPENHSTGCGTNTNSSQSLSSSFASSFPSSVYNSNVGMKRGREDA